MVKAIFPGSFDPFTNGHLDIATRASLLFDSLTIVIGNNTSKNSLFSPIERKKMIESTISNLQNVDVRIVDGLIIDYAQKNGVSVIVRGIRNSTDFDYEHAIATLNKNLDSKIETVCLITDSKYEAISSTMIKEIFKFNGNVSSYLPKNVLKAMKIKKE